MKWPGTLAAMLFLPPCTASAADVTGEDRRQVVEAVISHLESDYVDADVGRAAAVRLRADLEANAFSDVADGRSFADALTVALREATGDGHLNVEYAETAAGPDASQVDATFTAQEMERFYGARVNFGVKKVEQLDGNIGLLELTVFPPANMGGDTVVAAMQVVAHADVLIIDLRRNGGGSDTVGLVAGYLFDEPQPLSGTYDRPSDTLGQNHTPAYVPGVRFGSSKPVFVLISRHTFSAAEALAYDLQALKRATVVGQPSGGGAHPFTYRRIHPHFVLWSVTQKSVNPVTGRNWQGIGVQPDVLVDAEHALEKALELISAMKSQVHPSVAPEQ